MSKKFKKLSFQERMRRADVRAEQAYKKYLEHYDNYARKYTMTSEKLSKDTFVSYYKGALDAGTVNEKKNIARTIAAEQRVLGAKQLYMLKQTVDDFKDANLKDLKKFDWESAYRKINPDAPKGWTSHKGNAFNYTQGNYMAFFLSELGYNVDEVIY